MLQEKFAEFVFEVMKYTLPTLIIFLVIYTLFKQYLDKQIDLKHLEIRKDARKQLIPLRLQAYERMTIFLERISLDSMLTREKQSNQLARELQLHLMTSIRHEFEHNLSQQIYISAESWEGIVLAKNETIKIINLVGATLPEDASADQLSKALLDYVFNKGNVMPSQKALFVLKQEVVDYFGDVD